MASIKERKDRNEREQNLLNAMDTMAQFYDEIESFLDILFNNMEREGYTAKAERLRSGTFSIRNLSRRLLAAATIVYIKGIEKAEDLDEEEEEEDLSPASTGKKVKDKVVPITKDLRIPFVHLHLFPPNTIPSVRTLSSPMLHYGALGNMRFIEKRNAKPAKPASPTLSLSNLVQVPIHRNMKDWNRIRIDCWRPKTMQKYRMTAEIVGHESLRLLEIDSQEKIKNIARKLAEFGKG